ncbi:endonuclease/exonuclease/phosphatase family protein [Phytoactinopolyspora halophila]|uniref:endonuclease/exonuclease/phosphatase family protein n=1 Tax=Phytoactinopolyspora halophila TaxID=1981511 RepID=UPI001B8C8C2D|nr:endonuclease/exonuclease/phosphatase family protein [Phytoactinopolyspora halophila]
MGGRRVLIAAFAAALAGAGLTASPAGADSTVRIHDIQGAAHISPLNGQQVAQVPGVVTATASDGFWFEDPQPDRNRATAEGLFVRTDAQPTVATGDAVTVTGTVSEFRPDDIATNLTRTEITSPTLTVVSSDNSLPVTVIGKDRWPPRRTIKDNAPGDVETSDVFEPVTDGLDFWESLEGMRLEIDDAVAVGPTDSFGDVPVLARDGAGASVRTRRGGVAVRPHDFNPERLILSNRLADTPDVNVGDHFVDPVTGVLDYSIGNYKLLITEPAVRVADGPARETTRAPKQDELSIATLNVENLAATSPQAKFDQLAGLIVNNLKSPDLINVDELQDNSGSTDDGTVAADQTVAKLVAAIEAAGGPAYEWRAIDPQDKADGGWVSGNVRVGFLFRTDRGLNFVDRPGGDATTPTGVTNVDGQARLTLSPGRIDPGNAAFVDNRKPLAGEFTWRGERLIVVANDWRSKGLHARRYGCHDTCDQPLFGRFQPPALVTEDQRVAQATVVADFVQQIRAIDRDAHVVVAGQLNDYPWSPPLRALTDDTRLWNLSARLPLPERYTHVFDGNSHVLDHILLSTKLFVRPHEYDVVHVNAEYADQASDHDPTIVRITLS